MDEIGPLYRVCAQMGFTPREVDEMELWEVATILGIEGGSAGGGLSGDDLLAARVRAAKTGEAMPEAAPPVLAPEFGSLIPMVEPPNGD